MNCVYSGWIDGGRIGVADYLCGDVGQTKSLSRDSFFFQTWRGWVRPGSTLTCE